MRIPEDVSDGLGNVFAAARLQEVMHCRVSVGYLFHILSEIYHLKFVNAFEPDLSLAFRGACHPVDIFGQRVCAVCLNLDVESGIVENFHEVVSELKRWLTPCYYNVA